MIISRHVTPGLQYVNRGDPAAADFTTGTLTADGAWHTLDISAIVPVNAKLVVLRMRAANSAASRTMRVSKVGNVNAFACASMTTNVANIAVEQTTIIDCSGQHIQYWLTSATWADLGLTVLGWFL